jgi:alkyl hydroperoxide reductase subunit AhpC
VGHATVNDLLSKHDVNEALRRVDALRFHETRGFIYLAIWHEGQPSMTAFAEGVADYRWKYYR